MFAASPHLSNVVVLRRDGTAMEVRPADFVISLRPEAPMRALLPPHLCRAVSGAAEVRYLAYPDTSTRTLACETSQLGFTGP